MEHRLNLHKLSGDERLIILLYYFGEDGRMSETQIADDLTDLLNEPWTRDRVHTIRRSAERRLQRHAGVSPEPAT